MPVAIWRVVRRREPSMDAMVFLMERINAPKIASSRNDPGYFFVWFFFSFFLFCSDKKNPTADDVDELVSKLYDRLSMLL